MITATLSAHGYSAALLEHFDAPRNVGLIEGAVRAEAHSAAWGDQLIWSMRVSDVGKVTGIGWQCAGGVAVIACASAISEQLRGADIEAVRALDPIRVADELELPVSKRYAVLLVKEVLDGLLSQIDQGRVCQSP